MKIGTHGGVKSTLTNCVPSEAPNTQNPRQNMVKQWSVRVCFTLTLPLAVSCDGTHGKGEGVKFTTRLRYSSGHQQCVILVWAAFSSSKRVTALHCKGICRELARWTDFSNGVYDSCPMGDMHRE